jgi:uncharacterized protein (DUF1697 family)
MRYLAFLRAINVGGRVVRMADLRLHLVSAGFRDVETIIQTGNVVFESRSTSGAALERRMEAALESALGYPVGTFIRTPGEVKASARAQPFGAEEPAGSHTLNVAFLRVAPDAARVSDLRALSTDNDLVEVIGRELFWLRRERGKMSEQFSVQLGKVLGKECTVRNVTTVRRIADKYC